MKYYLFIIFTLLIIFPKVGYSQYKDEEKEIRKILPDKYTQKLDTNENFVAIISYMLLDKINEYRKESEVGEVYFYDEFSNIAKEYANRSADFEKSEKEKKSDYNFIQFPTAIGVSKSKEFLTYSEIVTGIMDKIKKQKTDIIYLNDGANFFVGMGSSIDEQSKKIYSTLLLGNYYTINNGADHRNELTNPYSKKKYGVKKYDVKNCKNCEKFNDYEKLYNGLYVENGKVYLKYENLKAIQKVFKGSKDGIAIDFVQLEQYPCDKDYNIYDNELLSKGIMPKPCFSSKMWKKNKHKGDKKLNLLDTYICKLPKKIADPYELNMHVILNKSLCKTVGRKYIEKSNAEGTLNSELLSMLNDTSIHEFVPRSYDTVFTFVIPFEKNEFKVNTDSINQTLQVLAKPNYSIDAIYIYAYTSIEGLIDKNERLRKKRANAVIEILEKNQKKKIPRNQVLTEDGWEQFIKEISETSYADLAKMPKEEAIAKISGQEGLLDSLESVLSKQRYSRIVLDVAFDVNDENEMQFLLEMYEEARNSNKIQRMLEIQKYIMNSIKSGKYKIEDLAKFNIPQEDKYGDMLLNNAHFKQVFTLNNVIDEDFYNEIVNLQTVSPSNNRIKYNRILCELRLKDFVDQNQATGLQSEIDRLYGSDLDSSTINKLNLELQFKIIKQFNVPGSPVPIVEACFVKIKSIFTTEETSWQNSMKLASIFAEYGDYTFAANLLGPHLKTEGVSDDLVFLYITICASSNSLFISNEFIEALRIAKTKNPYRFCQLFGDPYLTFQILDNPNVKAIYCEDCD